MDRVEKMLQEHMKEVERRVKSIENKVVFLGLFVILSGRNLFGDLQKDISEARMESQNILKTIKLLEAEQQYRIKHTEI